eukprot:5256523-Pleurochrysis_carterae.AAC.2
MATAVGKIHVFAFARRGAQVKGGALCVYGRSAGRDVQKATTSIVQWRLPCVSVCVSELITGSCRLADTIFQSDRHNETQIRINAMVCRQPTLIFSSGILDELEILGSLKGRFCPVQAFASRTLITIMHLLVRAHACKHQISTTDALDRESLVDVHTSRTHARTHCTCTAARNL